MSYPYADLAMFCIPTQRKNKPATSGKLRTRTMHGLKWFKANANCWTCQYSARLCATVYMFQGAWLVAMNTNGNHQGFPLRDGKDVARFRSLNDAARAAYDAMNNPYYINARRSPRYVPAQED